MWRISRKGSNQPTTTVFFFMVLMLALTFGLFLLFSVLRLLLGDFKQLSISVSHKS